MIITLHNTIDFEIKYLVKLFSKIYVVVLKCYTI